MIYKTVALTKGIRALFFRALMATPSLLGRYATITGSDSESEDYGWLGQVQAIREFLGERQVTGFTDAKYTITNKEWEGTIEVLRKELDRDKMGRVLRNIQTIAQRARNHPMKLIWDLINTGETGLCYDGVSFYNTAHPARHNEGGTQSNIVTGSGTSTANIKTDFTTALARLKTFKDEAGEPFHEMINPSDLAVTCPADLEVPIREALNASLISNTSNVLKGMVDTVDVSPYLSDTNDWFLHYLGDPVKPFVFQDETGIEFESETDGSSSDFWRKSWAYGIYARNNAGYGLWQNSIKVKN